MSQQPQPPKRLQLPGLPPLAATAAWLNYALSGVSIEELEQLQDGRTIVLPVTMDGRDD